MAGRAAGELAELRDACAAAIDTVYAAAPDLVLIVGAGDDTSERAASAIGTFGGYGYPLAVRLGGGTVDVADAAAATLPLSLTVGAWLLRDRPLAPPRLGQTIAADAPVDAAVMLGSAIAERSVRIGLVIMGDGSARHGPQAPGYDDPRAATFDSAVTAALAGADTAVLLALDVDRARDLLVAGRPAWQVLAGAVRASGGTWAGSVTYAAAPYGVQYTVATWRPVPA
jgi:hypothetical protein